MLLVLYELFFSGYEVLMLDLLSVIAILFGVYVVISKNPIMSVLFLIGLFGGIACYLIFTGITFIGLSYLLVYVGAVSILFLFILMLINVRISELLIENLNSIPLAILLGYFFFIFVNNASPFSIFDQEKNIFYAPFENND
jgi:NADH-ubiquinone oxidoreductase chain 6